MQIRLLEVKGFRSLIDFRINFEKDITMLVGENDSGKTSILDCLKVITQNKAIEIDDFTYGRDTLELKITIDDFTYEKKFKKEGNAVEEVSFQSKPTKEFLSALKVDIQSRKENITLDDNRTHLLDRAKLLGLSVRSNSNPETVYANLNDRIETLLSNPDEYISGSRFPAFNSIQLDGKHFENAAAFFKEVFLKSKQMSIWQEKVKDEMTIEEFIRTRIEAYSAEMHEQINKGKIFDKIKLFMKELTEIQIEPIYNSRELNIEAKVKFLENGKEIPLINKGDGTKRRITMALLEFKKEESLLAQDSCTTYLLDEPDTHLHVKAQRDLLETFKEFATNSDQVIITTHSPFLINAMAPNQIRFIVKADAESQLRQLQVGSQDSAKILNDLGIENTYLFFARYIIIVEGETEESFISSYYPNRTGSRIGSDLIKLINVQGIGNISGFARGILELHSADNLYLVCDNDASDDIKKLISELHIADGNKFLIGENEFEDAFSDKVLFECWSNYLTECGKPVPDSWSEGNIKALREKCATTPGSKFSKELKSLNKASKKMTKPLFGQILGRYIRKNDLPAGIENLFASLEKAS